MDSRQADMARAVLAAVNAGELEPRTKSVTVTVDVEGPPVITITRYGKRIESLTDAGNQGTETKAMLDAAVHSLKRTEEQLAAARKDRDNARKANAELLEHLRSTRKRVDELHEELATAARRPAAKGLGPLTSGADASPAPWKR